MPKKPAPTEASRARTDHDPKRPDGIGRTAPRDRVEDASIDSFPASDPPAWTGVRAGPP